MLIHQETNNMKEYLFFDHTIIFIFMKNFRIIDIVTLCILISYCNKNTVPVKYFCDGAHINFYKNPAAFIIAFCAPIPLFICMLWICLFNPRSLWNGNCLHKKDGLCIADLRLANRRS